MPISIQSLKKRTAVCDVYKVLKEKELEGQLLVEYRIVVDKTLLDDAEQAADKAANTTPEDEARRNAEEVVAIVVKWDLLDAPLEEGGKMIPLEVDAIMEQVPLKILIDVLNAIGEDRKLTKKK